MMSLLHMIYRLFYYWAHNPLPMMYTWWTAISVRCATSQGGSESCDRGAPSVAFVLWRLPSEARPSLCSVLIPLRSPLCASFWIISVWLVCCFIYLSLSICHCWWCDNDCEVLLIYLNMFLCLCYFAFLLVEHTTMLMMLQTNIFIWNIRCDFC